MGSLKIKYIDLASILSKRFKNHYKYLIALLVLFFLFMLFFPLFRNVITSTGDLPYYWYSYLMSLSIPEIWNPHWPTGLGGNQAIILPLKFYVQFSIPFLVTNLGLSWEILQKIIFFAVFIVISVSSSFFLTKSWIGTLIFTTNTWILMVFSGGQMGISLSYAVFPFALLAYEKLREQFDLRRSLLFGLIFSLQIMFDQRIALLTIGVLLILLIFSIDKNTINFSKIKKNLLLVSFIPLIILALNAFWVLPLIFSKIIGSKALQVIGGESGAASFLSFAFFENSISLLHPNWPENIFGKVYFMRPEFLILPILAFSSLVFLKAQEFNKIIIFFLLGLIGAFLAKGTNDPLGAIYVWLFENIPGFNLFRDPTKFYILVALSYAVVIPFTLGKMSDAVTTFASRFLKRDLNASSFHTLLSIIFIIFWGFTIRQAFFGELGGLFKETIIPKEYSKLKDHLGSQPEFFRTLWIPQRQRFGYFSDEHPEIDGYDIFGRISAASMTARLENADAFKLLADLSIKYVIVPYDSEGEIFLTDRKYDGMQWMDAVKTLDKNPNLIMDERFAKLRLYRIPIYYEHFYIREILGNVSQNVSYHRINNSRYLVSVQDAKAGDILIFSERYDLGWQAKSQDLTIFPTPYNGLLNGFVLPKDGDYSFEIYYKPQVTADVGFVISGVALFSIGLVLLEIRKNLLGIK